MKDKYEIKLDNCVSEIRRLYLTSPCGQQEIDSCFDKIADAMLLISNDLPKTKFKKNLKPFWDASLTKLKKG